MPSSTTEGSAAHLHFQPGHLHLQEQEIPCVALPRIRQPVLPLKEKFVPGWSSVKKFKKKFMF